jgi:hypothetical protein
MVRLAPWLLAALFTVLVVAPGQAAVWKRKRADGTEEFTNLKPSGGSWKRVKGGAGTRGGSGPNSPITPNTPMIAPLEPVSRKGGGTVWGRENADGTVEFTNLNPTGERWKVLYRTGPGKAAALRGSSDFVPARDRAPARFTRYDQHIRDQQAFYGIPQALVRAVIKVESDYDPRVVSSAGCVGLMQLMPETARSMGVTDIWEPRQNIMGGSRYLQVLAKRFCKTPLRGQGGGFMCAPEELVKVIAGYHAGPGAVLKYGGMPPYETTRSYVASVLLRYEEFRHREGQGGASTVATVVTGK